MLKMESDRNLKVTIAPPGSEARQFFEKLPALGEVDADRPCRVCRHNLRTQPIRRDPRTELLLCRCPQCGTFATIGESTAASAPAPTPSWTRFLARSLMYLWLLGVGIGGVAAAGSQAASSVLTLELLTTHAAVPANVARSPGYRGPAFQYVLKRDYREYQFLTAVAVLFSLGLMLGVGLVASVVFYHWPRWLLAAFLLIEPMVIAAGVCLIWRMAAPELWSWGLRIIGLHTAAQIVAGVIGALLGRPMVHLLTALVVPAPVRPVLRHLWQGEPQPEPRIA